MRWGGTLKSASAHALPSGRAAKPTVVLFFRPERPRGPQVVPECQDMGMKGSLAPGVAREERYTVTPEMAPAHLPVQVLSTPAMVQLIEGTCLQAAQDHLDQGETTVGTHICISHTGPAAAGEEVVVTCLLDKVDKRRLTFAVEVRSPRGTISEGTHQRAVVDRSRFG